MAPKDPGKLHYRKHNIYLNFLESYQRIPPETPITIHQKALFVFWISCISLTLILKIYSLMIKISSLNKSRDIDGEVGNVNESKHEQQQGESNVTNKEANIKDDPLRDGISQRGTHKKDMSPTDIAVKTTAAEADTVEKKIGHTLKDLSGKLNLAEEKQDSKLQEYLRPAYLKSAILEMLQSFDKDQPSFEQFVTRMSLFGCIMFYFWLTDYLHIWPKVEKQYSRDMFVFLFFLLVFVAFVFSIRTTKDKLLNRDQTEEWKGWMQVQFVWYHYFDALETYNSIRCYVGAYVWMTGFGNYIYFSTRKDYSIFRLLKMLFRLNFLVFCVMAVTNHEFVRYYICAMHTYWFLSVWAVMVAFNRYNGNPKFILLKFLIYFIINALIFDIPGMVHKVFIPFKFILDVKGNLDYWQYRSWLDHWSTLVGMLVAFGFTHYETLLKYLDKDDPTTKRKRDIIRATITSSLLVIFAVWFYFVLMKPQEEYLKLHPFTSYIPTVIYTWLRNQHSLLRTHYLNLFTWLGKITLETYLSQIHIYMMGDAKKILVYLPQYPMLNFTLSTLIYVTVSYVLFKLTVFFSAYLLPRNIQVVTKNFIFGSIWLGACYLLAHFLTTSHVWSSEKSGLEFLLWRTAKY